MTGADLLLYGALLVGVGPVLAAIVYVILRQVLWSGEEGE